MYNIICSCSTLCIPATNLVSTYGPCVYVCKQAKRGPSFGLLIELIDKIKQSGGDSYLLVDKLFDKLEYALRLAYSSLSIGEFELIGTCQRARITQFKVIRDNSRTKCISMEIVLDFLCLSRIVRQAEFCAGWVFIPTYELP